MLKNYAVCFTENIENRINDDDIFYDGDSQNGNVDCVFDVLAEDENSAKEQYLRLCAEKAYAKQEGITLIKRECAARVIRRIVAGQILKLPREVLINSQINRMITVVYDSIAELYGKCGETRAEDIFKHLANTIDLNEYANLLDEGSIVALYVELYMKDVFAQELKLI